MGPDEQTTSDLEADAFFAQFIDATSDVIARIAAEAGGDLSSVVAEGKAYGYWDRKMAARAARRAAQQRTAAAAQIATASRTSRPDERARLAPLSADSAALLPDYRVVRLTEAERRETRGYWRRLTNPATAALLVRSIAREERRSTDRQHRAEREQQRQTATWRLEQRAFERGQWQAVLLQRDAWRRKKIAIRWIAISEQRALEIAIAVLEHKDVPPQGRK